MQVLQDILNLSSAFGPSASSPTSSFASAAGKAIICGEHAVVYGATAVAMPLMGHKMQAELQVEHQQPADYVKMVIGDRVISDSISGVVHDAFKVFGIAPFPVNIEGKSFLPIGAGLGSSATLCVVIVRAIAGAIGVELSPDQVAVAANQLEARFHGRPSGLDTSVVAYERVISFKKGSTPQPIPIQPGWRFALIDSGIRASTLTMIEKASPYFQQTLGKDRIAQFDEWAGIVAAGLQAGDALLVAEGMGATGHMLSEAGVVPKSLQDMIDASLDCGTLASKITGAGGGGAILALLPSDADEAKRCIMRMKEKQIGHAIFQVEI